MLDIRARPLRSLSAAERGLADARVRAVLAGSLIAAAYLIFRLALLYRFPPFVDESSYAAWAAQGYSDAQQRFVSLTAARVEPLMMWMAMGLMKLGANPLTAVRLISLAAGGVAALMTGLVARRLAGTTVALVAAALAAFLPFVFVHDSIGILDPFVMATMMTALYLEIRLAEELRLDFALLAGIVIGLGLLTKATGTYALVLLPTTLLCFDWEAPRRLLRLARWVALAAAAVVVAVLEFWITKLSTAYTPLFGAPTPVSRSLGAALAHPLRWIGQNWSPLHTALTGYLSWPLVIAAAVGIGIVLSRRTRLGILVVIWALVPLVSYLLVAAEPYPRLVLVAVPPLAILIALALVGAAKRAWPYAAQVRFGRAAVVAALFLVLLPALTLDTQVLADPARAKYPGIDDWQFATGWPSGGPWRPLAHELERRTSGRPTIVVLGELTTEALPLLLRDDKDISWTDTGSGDAARAEYVVANGLPLPVPGGPGHLVTVWSYHRPRGGMTVRLLQRVTP